MFELKDFVSHAGLNLKWKINCDSLTDDDWDCLAKVVADNYSFKKVFGIPTGGLKFAKALEKHVKEDGMHILIADDVLTTGKSMQDFFDEHCKNFKDVIGMVVFDRQCVYDYPEFPVYALFTLGVPV